jgi:hypothetical protein
MLLQISTLKFWINLEPLDYFHLIGAARGGRLLGDVLAIATYVIHLSYVCAA